LTNEREALAEERDALMEERDALRTEGQGLEARYRAIKTDLESDRATIVTLNTALTNTNTAWTTATTALANAGGPAPPAGERPPKQESIRKPQEFDRSRDQLRPLIAQLRTKFLGDAHKFIDVQHRLAFAVGFLKGKAYKQILPLIDEGNINISKRNTLRSGSPRSPCAPDVPGAYNVNSCSGCVRPASFRPEVKGPRPMRPEALDAALFAS